jgi:hypothetical protein
MGKEDDMELIWMAYICTMMLMFGKAKPLPEKKAPEAQVQEHRRAPAVDSSTHKLEQGKW